MKSKINFWFLIILYTLILYGTWILFTASSIYAQNKFNNMFYFANKQVFWHLLGLIFMFLSIFFPIKFIKKYINFFLFLTIFLLILVFIPGIGKAVIDEETQLNFRRWIQIGGITFQPSEFAKITFILYLSYIFEKYPELDLMKIYKEILLIFIILILLFFEPQYGTMILLLLVGISLLIIFGFPIIRFFLISLTAIPILIFLSIIQPYRFERIKVWLDPYSYRYDQGYQIYMSFKAFKEGSLWGTDIYKGIAHRYLTYGYTDFIFPLLSESLGLVGVLFLLALYLSILILGYFFVKRIHEPFYYFLSTGILVLFLLQVIISISVTTGLLPVTGIGLPFVSYGGSSLISYYILFGLFLNIVRVKTKEEIYEKI